MLGRGGSQDCAGEKIRLPNSHPAPAAVAGKSLPHTGQGAPTQARHHMRAPLMPSHLPTLLPFPVTLQQLPPPCPNTIPCRPQQSPPPPTSPCRSRSRHHVESALLHGARDEHLTAIAPLLILLAPGRPAALPTAVRGPGAFPAQPRSYLASQAPWLAPWLLPPPQLCFSGVPPSPLLPPTQAVPLLPSHSQRRL